MNLRLLIFAHCITLTFFTFSSDIQITPPKTEKKNRKARKQEKLTQLKQRPAPKKMITKMNYEELKEAKTDLIARGNKDQALKYLEKMIPLCPEVQELGIIMLEYADLLFETGSLAKAGILFEQFARLYPGSAKVEYASYRAILCSFYELLQTDRDQTKTRTTIALSQDFLKRGAIFKEYSGAVNDILKTCHETLLTSELNIVSFYQQRGSFNAATTRLAAIEQEFNGIIPNLKPRLLMIECEMAQQQNNPELLKQKQLLLTQNFPDYVTPQNTVVAQTEKKPNLAARF